MNGSVRGLMLVMLVVPCIAHAGFLVERAAVKPQAPACDIAGLREVGSAEPARALIATAVNEPAAESLRRLVPRSWRVEGDVLDATRIVTWQGGRSWLSILQDVALDANLCIEMDHDAKTAIVTQLESEPIALVAPASAPAVESTAPAPAPVAAPVAVTVDVKESGAAASMSEPMPLLDDAIVEAPAGDQITEASATEADVTEIYEVRGGEFLRETFERWCAQAGWTLEWQADYRYVMEVPHEFPAGTTFEEAVKTTLRAYWHRKHPLVGRPSLNRVLVVTGRR